jgi:hypothetical protein
MPQSALFQHVVIYADYCAECRKAGVVPLTIFELRRLLALLDPEGAHEQTATLH